VDIEKVRSLEVVRSELGKERKGSVYPFARRRQWQVKRERRASHLAKMDLIEDDLIGMADTPEPCEESQTRDEAKGHSVGCFGGSRLGLGLR